MYVQHCLPQLPTAGEVVIFDRSSRESRSASTLIFFSGLGLGVRCPAPPKCSLVDFAQTAHSIVSKKVQPNVLNCRNVCAAGVNN